MNRVMRKAPLIPHPDHPAPAILIGGYFHVDEDGTGQLGFALSGAIDDIVLPPPLPERTRRDELWLDTCFELFVHAAGANVYHEFNFAPGGDWAAYRFDSYRAGMTADPSAAPLAMERVDEEHGPVLRFTFASDALRSPAALQIGLSAVIADRAGDRSFWAIAHPPGKPDFHHPDCFARELAAVAES